MQNCLPGFSSHFGRFWVACLLSNFGLQAVEPPRAVMPERHRALLTQHCQGCHGEEKQKGKFRVDDLPLQIADAPTAERWQKVLNALNSGEMPPEDEKQPEPGAKTDFLDDLSNVMVTARKSLGDQHGVIALRRLNRREYHNTLRDLLGVEVDVSELPSDTGGTRFDTVGASLFVTSNQIEQYEALGLEALEEAFSAHSRTVVPKKFHLEMETLQKAFLKRNRDALDARERARLWLEAVDEAALRPENAAKVAELRLIAKTDDALRYHWKKIPGAPSPTEFGFDKTTEVNPAIVYLYRDRPEFIKYDEYYQKLPLLDQGIYLTVSTRVSGGHGATAVPGFSIPADYPPGEYVVRIRVGASPGSASQRRFLEFGLKGFLGQSTPALSTHHVTGSLDAPQILEIPFTFTRKNAERGHRNLFVRERGVGDPTRSEQMLAEGIKQNGFGPEAVIWVDWMEIEPKAPALRVAAPGIRSLGIPLNGDDVEVSEAQLRGALERFALEAYRGVRASPGLVDRLVKVYHSRKAIGDKHREALKHSLALVLSSPRFLYRAEPDVNASPRRLNGIELAVRLSYFLRGGPPDETLRVLAASGQLLKQSVLLEQTERLLSHPDSVLFMQPFLTQWLGLDRLDLFQFSKSLFPRFDDATKYAARQEVHETFAHLFRTNAPITDLLSADYAMLNGILADYYGVQGVEGDGFRKVKLPADSPRGGLLGMAAIMAMGSNGQRSNPVERGAWVLRKLLNEPPPPAPANVPEIARLAGKLLTTRERLQAHQESPQCANCHRKIDPIGFGLENFDAVGQWRVTDFYRPLDEAGNPDPTAKKTWFIEAAAVMHKGPAFKNFFEMRGIIATKKDAFARGFSSALIEYALGRPCGFSDEALVETMVSQAGARGYASREFVRTLVLSKEFQTK